MNKDALRIALSAPEAWGCLTDRQRETVAAFVEHRTLAGTARQLGVDRQAVRKSLHLAGKKFLEFARAM